MHLLPHPPQLNVSVIVSTHPASQAIGLLDVHPGLTGPEELPESLAELLPEPLPASVPPEPLPLLELLEPPTPDPLPELTPLLPPLDVRALASGSMTGVLVDAPAGGVAVSLPFADSPGSAQ
jgi:hypothetical protein